MPLIRRDKSSGGTSDDNNFNRRSLSDLLGLETMQGTSAMSAPSDVSQPLEYVDGAWSWYEASSPEAAESPRALVPAACFPPRHSTSYASHSESAQLEIVWPEESISGQRITALASSLESMKMPSERSRSMYGTVPQSISLSHDQLDTAGVQPWPPEQAGTSTQNNRSNYLNRRASFCGGTPVGRDWAGLLDKRSIVMWSGSLPPRCVDPSGGFSAKVFLGGLPWDIGEQALLQTLKQFNPVRVEWPVRESGGGGGGGGGGGPRGYAYVTFENERRVRALLAASRCDGRDWYYHITSRKMRNKEVQVIPWAVSDSNWMTSGAVRLEPNRTVFVGALHGMMSAQGLAKIMNELFPGVIYAGIDTDKYKYPIGSGRVTFNNLHSYICAISAAFIEIHTPKFNKKIQIDPYLEDSMCSICNLRQGPYFCREPICFGYYCRACWVYTHSNKNHKPLMRCSKNALSKSVVSLAQCNGVRQLALPAPPSSLPLPLPLPLPAIAAHAHDVADQSVYNGAYSRRNDSIPSPGSGSGMSLFSAASEQEPCIAAEAAGPAEPAWPR